jgi:hypothetical protein
MGATSGSGSLHSAGDSNANLQDLYALSYELVPTTPVPDGSDPVVGPHLCFGVQILDADERSIFNAV